MRVKDRSHSIALSVMRVGIKEISRLIISDMFINVGVVQMITGHMVL
jgi:hypothetical protein